MNRNISKLNPQSRFGSYQSPKNDSEKENKHKKSQFEKELKEENLSPQRLLRGIKKIRNKGILSLGEHGNTNVVIDTDSELSYEEKKPSEVKLKKGTTKLLVSKMEQSQLDSTKKNLANIKSQRRDRLSNYIVKPEDKYYTSPMNITGRSSGNSSLNKDYNIKIPGSLSRSKKRKELAITSNKLSYYGNEQENEELTEQGLLNPIRERNIRQRRNEQQGNLEIFVSPDVKITTNIQTPNISYINSPSYNYYTSNPNYRNLSYAHTGEGGYLTLKTD